MWENMRFRSNQENAGVVAAAFVCTLAAVGLAAAVLLSTRNTGGLMLSGGVLVSGFAVAAIVLLVGRRFSSTDTSSFVFFRKQEPEDSVDYVPRKRRSKRNDSGTHAPPTVAEIHELKENTNTWVPSGKPPQSQKHT